MKRKRVKSRTNLYVFLLVSFFSIAAKSQSTVTDSATILSYANKAQDFLQTNVDSAVYYANKSYKLAKATKSNYLQCRSTIVLAIVSQNVTDYKKAAFYFREGIALAEKGTNKAVLAQSYNGFANMFALQKQFGQASEYFHKALVICKEIKDTTKTSVILMNLANIEYNNAFYSNDYRKSNLAYKEAYEWALLAKDTGQQISCLGNWGLSYSDESKFDLSLEKLNRAIELANQVNYTADLISLKHYLGRTYGYLKEYPKAINSFSESLKLAEQFKDVDYLSENYVCLANTNYEMGNYKEAFDFYKKHKTIEDTISSQSISNELNAIKVKYDTEKKQKEIELLKVNANKNKIVNISLIVGGVLLLLLIVVILNRYRLKEKTNKLLESQNHIISEKNKDISDSINYAKKIQDAILPSIDDIQKVFPESFILSIPKDVVSGDFYWFTQQQHLKLFAVADCTGHGVPGALMSMIGNTLLNSIVNERKIVTPDFILNELRKEIISVLKQSEGSSNKDGMDISLCCLNTQTNVLTIACANNPVWIVRTKVLDNAEKTIELIEVKPDKQPIGYASSTQKEFTLQSVALQKGDIIYQFTDGFADQFGGVKGKKFKYNQLKEILLSNKNSDIHLQAEILRKTFIDWKGNLEQIDDVLVTGIKIT